VKALFDGVKCFDTPKPLALLERIIALTTSGSDLVLDFFGGSGTTGHAVFSQNARDSSQRRFVVVQLPEPIDGDSKEQKIAADLCDELGLKRSVAELTKERLRRASVKTRGDFPAFQGDLGFRVFKLDSSNIRAWNPVPADLEQSLFEHQEHLIGGRTEADELANNLLFHDAPFLQN
jgi:adenine-specific DNA-methyltransferase